MMVHMPSDLLQVMAQLPTYLRDLAYAVAAKAESDVSVALPTLLSGMGAAVIGLRRIERPDGGHEALGTFQFVISGRTTGKTETFKLVHARHRAHDIFQYENHVAAKSDGTPNRLHEVLHPVSTGRMLLASLEGVGQSTSISAHEGNVALRSNLFRRQLDILNVLFDGEDKSSIPLPNGTRLTVLDGSVNMLIMVQGEVFGAYDATNGETARAIGFYSRCLFTVAPAVPSVPQWARPGADRLLDEYSKDVSTYLAALEAKQKNGVIGWDTLTFSPAARAIWLDMKAQARQSAYYYPNAAQDACNRAMQNVTRLAGIIHSYYPHRLDDPRWEAPRSLDSGGLIAGPGLLANEVSTECLLAAWALVHYHLGQVALVFPPKPWQPQPAPKLSVAERRERQRREDADAIMFHLIRHIEHTGEPAAEKGVVRMRTGLYRQRFDAALFSLTDKEHLLEEGSAKKTRLKVGRVPYIESSALVRKYGEGFLSSV